MNRTDAEGRAGGRLARSGSSSRSVYRHDGADVTVVEVLPQICGGGCRIADFAASSSRSRASRYDRRQGHQIDKKADSVTAPIETASGKRQ